LYAETGNDDDDDDDDSNMMLRPCTGIADTGSALFVVHVVQRLPCQS